MYGGNRVTTCGREMCMSESKAEYRTAAPGRAWECKNCGITLGYIVRGNDRIYRLHMCYEVVDELNGARPLVVIAVGDVEVCCPACGEGRRYHAGEAALDELLKRREHRRDRLDKLCST